MLSKTRTRDNGEAELERRAVSEASLGAETSENNVRATGARALAREMSNTQQHLVVQDI